MTGFKLTTKVDKNFRNNFLLGYMTIINGYGITVNYYNLNELTANNNATINSYKMNTNIYVSNG